VIFENNHDFSNPTNNVRNGITGVHSSKDFLNWLANIRLPGNLIIPGDFNSYWILNIRTRVVVARPRRRPILYDWRHVTGYRYSDVWRWWLHLVAYRITHLSNMISTYQTWWTNTALFDARCSLNVKCYCFMATFVHNVGQMGRTTFKCNEAWWKMKHPSDIARARCSLNQ